jgi:DNA-directed RNA polymerase specialized sigma24 family protein
MPPTRTINPLTEQEEMVFRLCEAAKLTRREIARQLEVSSSRVRQIYAAAKTKLRDFAEHGEDALTLLPARSRQVVLDCGIPSRSQARSAIESGRLTWAEGIGGIFWEGTMLPKVSRKSWAALHAWAGHPQRP